MISPLNLSKRSTHGLDTLTRGELVSRYTRKMSPSIFVILQDGYTGPPRPIPLCVCEGVGVRVRMGWFSAVCLRVCVRAWACARASMRARRYRVASYPALARAAKFRFATRDGAGGSTRVDQRAHAGASRHTVSTNYTNLYFLR